MAAGMNLEYSNRSRCELEQTKEGFASGDDTIRTTMELSSPFLSMLNFFEIVATNLNALLLQDNGIWWILLGVLVVILLKAKGKL